MSDASEYKENVAAGMREEYNAGTLSREDLAQDPIAQFIKWFEVARVHQKVEPNAMSLSTIGEDGFPASRMVLLKFFGEEGFVFYTNYGSAKAKEIELNAKASLLFPWLELERQVRIEGVVEKVSDGESEAYFASRPRESQIGAWVSEQSSVVGSREVLNQEWDKYTAKFEGKEVPRPAHWGGYRVKPVRLEFWQGGKGRVHDRFRYTKTEDGSWNIDRLAP